jgi:hypothetical protein
MPAMLAEVEHVRQREGEPRLDVRALERLLGEAGAQLPADVNAFVGARLRAHPAYGGAAPAR